MTTRRDFLKTGVAAAAGVVFCSCGMLHDAHAQGSRQKLPVSVGGKRIRTIDVHAHCVIPEASKLLGPGAPNTVRGGDEVVIDMTKTPGGNGFASRRYGSAVDQSELVQQGS